MQFLLTVIKMKNKPMPTQYCSSYRTSLIVKYMLYAINYSVYIMKQVIVNAKKDFPIFENNDCDSQIILI